MFIVSFFFSSSNAYCFHFFLQTNRLSYFIDFAANGLGYETWQSFGALRFPPESEV